jgi:hypothetical protein
MSASTPSVAIDHPTVVPANFEPERRDADDESAADPDTEA